MYAQTVTAYVALGANLGNAVHTLTQAMKDFNTIPRTRLVTSSSLYQTTPIDSAGPDYINAVAEIETFLSAPELLRQLQVQELAAGRLRPYANAPRTLDLDILLYGSAQVQSPALTVPHPRMWQRAFVLQPLAEIAPLQVPADALYAVRHQNIIKLQLLAN